MSAFSYDTLWTKSKLFVDRAVAARDDGDGWAFALWAALAQEVLGKASLARVHPTLVADPSHFPSLLAAATAGLGIGLRSIAAKTVYERLREVAPGFDERSKSECLQLAERRNAELHSGLSPLVGLDPASWVPNFWKVSDLLVRHQGKQLEDWVGAGEAARVREVLQNNAELLRQTVVARITRRRAEFDALHPPGTPDRQEAEIRSAGRPLPARLFRSVDAIEEAVCPACGLRAWMYGSVDDEEIVEDETLTAEGWPVNVYEILRITYSVEGFACPECDLRLEGHDEIRLGGVPTGFVREEEREPDYGPQYSNE